MQRGQCVICHKKHRSGQSFGKCAGCRRQAKLTALLHTSGPRATQPGKAERVELYRAIVAAGGRLFE